MRGAHGVIFRRTSAEVSYHGFEQEFVVVIRATHRASEDHISHHVFPLSIEAATKLHKELGEVLNTVEWDFLPPDEEESC